ncbi:MAG: nuclear transport factor 2 family protein, partial [Pseudomonadota bacterium]
PSTEQYANYPTFHIPAFHFKHPVTGREPQYPEGDPAIGKPTGLSSTTDAALNDGSLFDSATLPAQVAAATVRSQRALATDAVENLVNAYGYYLDECMTQDVAALFAENGVNEIAGIGYYEGAAKIANALKLAYCPAGRQENALTLHHVLQPVITVDDDGMKATVVARLWQVHATGADDDYYLMGELNGEAVKQGEQWKLASLGTTYKWAASVKDGWARATDQEALGYAAPVSMLTELPPDRPAQTARLAPAP